MMASVSQLVLLMLVTTISIIVTEWLGRGVGPLMTNRQEPYSSQKIPAFVINRDTRPDRMQRFLSSARKQRGLDIVRVSATEVSSDDVPAGSGLTRGEVGCFMSHVGIWEMMIRNRIKEALVLEDDANLDGLDLVQDIERCRDDLPPGWNVVFLGVNHFELESIVNPCFLRQKEGSYGSHALFINLMGAGRAYHVFKRRGIEKPIDIFLSSGACECNYYLLSSNKVKQFDPSDTDTQRLR